MTSPAWNPADVAERAIEEVPLPSAPTFDPAALYGPAGQLVKAIGDTTEASPPAILASVLTATGALVGRTPCDIIDGSAHHCNLFTLLAGPSSTGRKSTAIQHGAFNMLAAVDADFRAGNVSSGMSTGEGIIDATRDATPDRMHGDKVIPGDPGVTDKRLLVVENELAGAFQRLSREGNSLSAVLRDAYDGRTLRTLTRNNRLTATDPHVCILGAITPSEVGTSLKSVEVSNGFANRFLFVWTNRVRLLPHPKPIPPAVGIAHEALAEAVLSARRVGRARWTTAGADLWGSVYPELSAPAAGGALASLLARGPTHVRRLTLLFAALDGTADLDVPHLSAALAFWAYCAASVRFVFGQADTLSPRARRVLGALQAAGTDGLDRSAIRKVIGSNNVKAEEIDASLSELRQGGLAQATTVATGGRSREVWTHAQFMGSSSGEGWEAGERTPDVIALHSHSSQGSVGRAAA